MCTSVADPGCLSRIPDPDFYPSRISDPGSKNSNKREGWKKICCHNFLCSHKFHKIANYYSFEVLKKKIWANFQRIIELLPKKLSNIWVWDSGSEIQDPEKNLFRIPDPGVKKAPDPNPQHWCVMCILIYKLCRPGKRFPLYCTGFYRNSLSLTSLCGRECTPWTASYEDCIVPCWKAARQHWHSSLKDEYLAVLITAMNLWVLWASWKLHQRSVLRIRIRDPVPFWPLDPVSQIQNPYFWELSDNFLGKSSLILWKLAQIFFFSLSKVK